MHGRRGTGVERRKWGHSWYQSYVCVISFSSYPLYCCMHNWTKECILFLFFHFLLKSSSSHCFTFLLPSEPQMWHTETWIASSTSPLPSSSHPVWPSRFVSGHLLQRAQGDTWFLRHRWLAVSPGFLTTASCPCWSLLLFHRNANLWFCCEGHRSDRLTHFQLTDTIIHCLHWECWVCMCVEQCLLDSLPDIFCRVSRDLAKPASWSKSMKPN